MFLSRALECLSAPIACYLLTHRQVWRPWITFRELTLAGIGVLPEAWTLARAVQLTLLLA